MLHSDIVIIIREVLIIILLAYLLSAHHHKGMGSGDNIIVPTWHCMDVATHTLIFRFTETDQASCFFPRWQLWRCHRNLNSPSWVWYQTLLLCVMLLLCMWLFWCCVRISQDTLLDMIYLLLCKNVTQPFFWVGDWGYITRTSSWEWDNDTSGYGMIYTQDKGLVTSSYSHLLRKRGSCDMYPHTTVRLLLCEDVRHSSWVWDTFYHCCY